MKYKEYIIINELDDCYPYHTIGSMFTSNINDASARSYADCHEVCRWIHFSPPYEHRNLKILNKNTLIRKQKLQTLNKFIKNENS